MNIESLYNIYLQHPTVCTDSRACTPGSMFFALKGDNFDGNHYASVALENGSAVAVIDEEEYAVEGDERYVLVDDVMESLQELAAYHRSQLDIPVIQITGTNGKTTTKELVSAVLSRKFVTRHTLGNLNNHLGVPRTLLSITAEDEIAVVETGANHPGEIEFLCRMVQADYGLITNVGRAHLEGFGSFEGVKKTKGELYDDLVNRSKTAFLNMMDTDLLEMWMSRTATTTGGEEPKSIPYVQGVVLECNPFLKVVWLDMSGQMPQRHEVQTHLIGSYNLANILAAVTVGLHFGVPASEINKALEDYCPTNSRSELRQTEKNTLIVDAYNANPTSMAAALENFRLIEAEHKMVILGEMRELGANSQEEHEAVRSAVLDSNLDEAWMVGENFMKLPPVENGKVKISYFANVEEVKTRLEAEPIEGRTILIKGSNGTKLYQIPEKL